MLFLSFLFQKDQDCSVFDSLMLDWCSARKTLGVAQPFEKKRRCRTRVLKLQTLIARLLWGRSWSNFALTYLDVRVDVSVVGPVSDEEPRLLVLNLRRLQPRHALEPRLSGRASVRRNRPRHLCCPAPAPLNRVSSSAARRRPEGWLNRHHHKKNPPQFPLWTPQTKKIFTK